MLLPFLHDNDGWQDRLAQLQTPSSDAEANDSTGDTAGKEEKAEDELQANGGTKP